MTGTAMTEAEEFASIYGLDTIEIPTNKPITRVDKPDAIYKNTKGKYMAMAEKIKELHQKGQPVLVGTVSIEKSEIISKLLKSQGVQHKVLNAKHHEKEAEIVAKAGEKGAVTIATNMAGRGTDIKLGPGVLELGGLYVMGTERHESRRIDNQLRGRSGRQGDPGETQFYVSMEDDLMRLFGADSIKKMMEVLKVPDDMSIQNSRISKSIENAQKAVEGKHFDIRKHLVEYDDIMNKHREIMYKRRRDILEAENIYNELIVLMENEVTNIVMTQVQSAEVQRKKGPIFDYQEIIETMNTIHRNPENPLKLEDIERVEDEERLTEILREHLISEYKQREKVIPDFNEEEGSPTLRKAEKSIYFRVIDTLWMQHIDEMSHLRDNVALRSYGQRDPLTEYKAESFRIFGELQANIQKTTVNTLFKIKVRDQAEEPLAVKQTAAMKTNEKQIESIMGGLGTMAGDSVNRSTFGGTGSQPTQETPKVGRNEPCPCGSGKKFKKCCGK